MTHVFLDSVCEMKCQCKLYTPYIYIFMFNSALHAPQLSSSSLRVTGDCNALPFFFQNRKLHVSFCTFPVYL